MLCVLEWLLAGVRGQVAREAALRMKKDSEWDYISLYFSHETQNIRLFTDEGSLVCTKLFPRLDFGM